MNEGRKSLGFIYDRIPIPKSHQLNLQRKRQKTRNQKENYSRGLCFGIWNWIVGVCVGILQVSSTISSLVNVNPQ